MNKSAKGALAATAAGVLLLGGAGTLAFWSDSEDVTGKTFNSGYLQLIDSTCSTGGWTIDGGAAYVAQRIVPGDVLTKTCSFGIDGVGDHLDVTLDTVTPDWDTANALTAQLDVVAAFVGSTTGTIADGDTVANSETVTATITVTFDGAAATNASNVPTAGLAAALDDVTIVATQGHDAS